LRKQTYPEVSYCGYIDSTEESTLGIKARLRRLFVKPEEDFYAKGAAVRGKAVRRLQHDKNVKYNFIIRQGFWAEGMTDKKAARKQYAENMLQSPYALVARGAGNFSYRLYEVMSCGRIPLFINTDCVLPYENLIDWKKSCVWLEEKEVEQISSKLIRFHHSISEQEFEARQINNRKIYEEWISPVGFFRNLKLLVKA
jgi:spore maturation protein CgeB